MTHQEFGAAVGSALEEFLTGHPGGVSGSFVCPSDVDPDRVMEATNLMFMLAAIAYSAGVRADTPEKLLERGRRPFVNSAGLCWDRALEARRVETIQ